MLVFYRLDSAMERGMMPDALGWKRHCQVHEKSLPDAFPLRKAEGVGRAKREGLVKAQNPL
jgi:hypothetical protein